MWRGRTHKAGDARDDDIAAQVAVVLVALMLVLLLLAIAIALEVARAHRTRGELGRALAVEHMTRQHLGPVRAQWESDLQARRDQWDRDAADVFAAAAGRAAQRSTDPAPAPESDATDRSSQHRTERAERAKKVAAAASGPLTPPTAPAAKRTRRAYYTELSADEKSMMQVRRVTDAAFADRDINPRRWPDDMLDEELQHLRTEVALLVPYRPPDLGRDTGHGHGL
jgi:hypothetical protein